MEFNECPNPRVVSRSSVDESCFDYLYWKTSTGGIQFLINVSWCPLCSIKTRNSYIQNRKKKSNLAIFQDFSDARPMPFTRYLHSRFVSIKINEFRISKTFNSCLACLPVRSWIQVLYTATQLLEEYNYSTHRPGISNLRLWRIILKGRNFFFYVPFFTILIFGKVSVMGYFEIVSVKKVHKLVYIDLIAFKCIIPCKTIGRCKNNTCDWLYSQQPYS